MTHQSIPSFECKVRSTAWLVDSSLNQRRKHPTFPTAEEMRTLFDVCYREAYPRISREIDDRLSTSRSASSATGSDGRSCSLVVASPAGSVHRDELVETSTPPARPPAILDCDAPCLSPMSPSVELSVDGEKVIPITFSPMRRLLQQSMDELDMIRRLKVALLPPTFASTTD